MAREIRSLASGPPFGAAPGAHFMTRKFSEERDIIKIAILAIGGQGGGVLADWVVHLAEANGYYAQTTSVPGVAQRTGATIYYLELVPETGRTPVLSLMPAPGDVDIVSDAQSHHIDSICASRLCGEREDGTGRRHRRCIKSS
jgi:hypothetical protein